MDYDLELDATLATSDRAFLTGFIRLKLSQVISPETRSSLYARIAFTWLHPMVIKAFTGRLQETDVWAMDRALRIKIVFQDYIENR